MINAGVFFLSLLGGVLPALLWLWFWLREDRLNPEPRGIIFSVFLAGMAATIVSLIFQIFTKMVLPNISPVENPNLFSLTIWAGIEEITKFLAAYYFALRRRDNDEPVDNMIYLITAAIGFSALENTFFLADPISKLNFAHSILTGDLRFIGTTPLHMLTSAIIGIALAYAFCKPPSIRKIYLTIGIVLAILLHTAFNELILISGSFTGAFLVVWFGVIILILFFEKVKLINKSCVYD